MSAHSDLYDLKFIRWNKHEEWSPWNCIFLTKEEAAAHEKLENVTEVCSTLFPSLNQTLYRGHPKETLELPISSGGGRNCDCILWGIQGSSPGKL